MSKIETDDPIMIRKVANGYELTVSYPYQDTMNHHDDIHVFESFESLVGFLEDHFTWRNVSVKEDFDDEKLSHN